MPVNLRLHLCWRAQRVPQRINLVEHHQARTATIARSGQVFTPNGKVGFGDPRVGRQNEHHCMRLCNQADGQFRLCAHGVEPRRVQNHQPLPEQWMGNIDERMAPARYLDEPVEPDRRIVLRLAVVPKAQRPRLVRGDQINLSHLFQRLRQLRRIIHVQVNLLPFFRRRAPVHQRLRLAARLNGKQSKARHDGRVITQFGRTHGGASRARGHDAPPVAGKENGVDEFRLAARKLRHKGHHHLVRAQLRFQRDQPLLHGGIQQVVLHHPLRKLLQARGRFAPPGAVLFECMVERHGALVMVRSGHYGSGALSSKRMDLGNAQGFWQVAQ